MVSVNKTSAHINEMINSVFFLQDTQPSLRSYDNVGDLHLIARAHTPLNQWNDKYWNAVKRTNKECSLQNVMLLLGSAIKYKRRCLLFCVPDIAGAHA